MVNTTSDPLPLMFDVHPGREVIHQGESYPDAWVVRTGALLMEVVDLEGHRLALDLLGPGDLVGGPTSWTLGRLGPGVGDQRTLRGGAHRAPRRSGPASAASGLARLLSRLGSDRGSARDQARRPRCTFRTPRAGRVVLRAAAHAGASRRPHGSHSGEREQGAHGARRRRTRRAVSRPLRRPARSSRDRGAPPTPRTAASQGSMNRSSAPCP